MNDAKPFMVGADMQLTEGQGFCWFHDGGAESNDQIGSFAWAIADLAVEHLRILKHRPKQKPHFAELLDPITKA